MNCADCKNEIKAEYYAYSVYFATLTLTRRDDVPDQMTIQDILCGKCSSDLTDLGKMRASEAATLDLLMEKQYEVAKSMRLIMEKIHSGGPIAINDNITIVLDGSERNRDGSERLKIKITDYKKGYWAECPLSERDMLILHELIAFREENEERSEEQEHL